MKLESLKKGGRDGTLLFVNPAMTICHALGAGYGDCWAGLKDPFKA